MSSLPSANTPTGANATPVNNNPAYNLLSRVHSESKATTIFTDKIKNKPLLLQPSHTTTTVSSSTATAAHNKRSLRRHIRLRKKQYHLQHSKPRPLSAKEKRVLGIYDLQRHEIKYDIYRGLNLLWRGYILEILGLKSTLSDSNDKGHGTGGAGGGGGDVGPKTITPSSHGSLLASADFHGMNVEIVRSVDVGRVGLVGIVVRESKSTLVIVTTRDKVVNVPKRGAVFRVVIPLVQHEESSTDQPQEKGEGQTKHVPAAKVDVDSYRQLIFELHGSQLEIRPVERAVRKFKWKSIDYL